MILLLKVLVFPRRVFDEIQNEIRYKLPLWLILIVGYACFVPTLIDFDSEYQIFSIYFQVIVSMVISLWFASWSLLILLAWASYYWLIGNILTVRIGWRDWFGFTCWTAVPSIIGSVLGVLILAFATVDPGAVFDSNPWFGWFGMTFLAVFGIPIPLAWSLYIAVNGFVSLSNRGLITSIVVVVTPVALLTMLQALSFVPIISAFVGLTSY